MNGNGGKRVSVAAGCCPGGREKEKMDTQTQIHTPSIKDCL